MRWVFERIGSQPKNIDPKRARWILGLRMLIVMLARSLKNSPAGYRRDCRKVLGAETAAECEDTEALKQLLYEYTKRLDRSRLNTARRIVLYLMLADFSTAYEIDERPLFQGDPLPPGRKYEQDAYILASNLYHARQDEPSELARELERQAYDMLRLAKQRRRGSKEDRVATLTFHLACAKRLIDEVRKHPPYYVVAVYRLILDVLHYYLEPVVKEQWEEFNSAYFSAEGDGS